MNSPLANSSSPGDRRGLLAAHPNPDTRLDYVVTLNGHCRAAGYGCRVELRYVPDRLVLDAAGFETYLAAVSGTVWDNLEHAAVTLLDDLDDELVARWIQIGVTGGDGHAILLEQRQPKWDNERLLRRLKRV
jgi:7-cyano-7-deazaguanine reductase